MNATHRERKAGIVAGIFTGMPALILAGFMPEIVHLLPREGWFAIGILGAAVSGVIATPRAFRGMTAGVIGGIGMMLALQHYVSLRSLIIANPNFFNIELAFAGLIGAGPGWLLYDYWVRPDSESDDVSHVDAKVRSSPETIEFASRSVDDNPYSSPSAPSTPAHSGPRPSIDGVWVHGKYLIVPPNATLPPICVKTGQAIARSDLREHYLDSGHSENRSSICKLTFGLDPKIRARYRARLIANILVVVLSFIGIPTIGFFSNVGLAVCLIVFIAGVFSLLTLHKPLQVVLLESGAFRVSGCSPVFLAAIEELAVQHHEEYWSSGGRNCLSCGILFKPSETSVWSVNGYCSKVCFAERNSVEAVQAASSSMITETPLDSPDANSHRLTVTCPAGHTFRIASSFSGLRRPCPTCGQKTTVP